MAGPYLFTSDPELRDLARGSPPLVDADSGRHTGARLVRWLGTGGMSTVFLAELDGPGRSDNLPASTPSPVAVKFLKPALHYEAYKLNIDSAGFFVREVVALGRMMERQPPTEYVVAFYGSGHSTVQLDDRTLVLPWLAIEYVDGGASGGTLTDRLLRTAPGGFDPVRVLRLAARIIKGVGALHEERIIHRDLKPDNVLVAGPVDDEIPKLADCGIARVDDILSTVAAATPAYGGPEQLLSTPLERNPLVGPWTDVHSLAAVLWFLLGGESWCRGDNDLAWHEGTRRSLRTAQRLHDAWLSDPALLDRIDAVLTRGAAQRLPAQAITVPGAEPYLQDARLRFASMFSGEERYASVDELAAALLPLLRQGAAAWERRCAVENRPSTAFRSTEPSGERPGAVLGSTTVARAAAIEAIFDGDTDVTAAPGATVFRHGGKVIVRFRERLLYLDGGAVHRIGVPLRCEPMVAASRWLVRGPAESCAAIGTRSILLIGGNRCNMVSLPRRPSGGEVGDIQAVIGDADVFGIITAETDDSNGGAELWTSSDGVTWSPPVVVPLGGDVRGVCHGPHGYILVGARRGTRGRAMCLPFDHQPILFVAGVNEGPPLDMAIWGTGRDAWAAGSGLVLCLQRGAVTPEAVDSSEPPVAFGLDLHGVPWLLTARSVLRRQLHRGAGTWKTLHRAQPGQPPFIGIGFTADHAHILDAKGNSTWLQLSGVAAPGRSPTHIDSP